LIALETKKTAHLGPSETGGFVGGRVIRICRSEAVIEPAQNRWVTS